MKTRSIRTFTTLLLILSCSHLAVFSQPVFTSSAITNYDFVIVNNTVIKDQNNWLVYAYASDSFPINYSYHLFKTTDGGNNYTDVTTFPSGARKFLNIGDTVFAVGTQLLRSTDFGSTWNTFTPPSPSEEYDDIVLLPNNMLWISGAKTNSSNYYQTDLNFSSFTPKLSLPTFSQFFNYKKHLSNFSADTLYFVKTNGNYGFDVHKTFDNGNTWINHNLPIDSIYFAQGDTSSVLSGIYRIPYIKYFNASDAILFTFASGFPKDIATNDAFNTISYLPALSNDHMVHEPVNWVTCGQNNYLVYDAHEDSSPGLQEITYTLPSTFNLSNYHFAGTTQLSHTGNFALGSWGNGVNLISDLCSPLSVSNNSVSHNQFYITPNPGSGNISVHYVNFKNTKATLQVLDAMGRVVLLSSLPYNGSKQELNLQHIPSGIYLFKLSSSEKNASLKFIKR